MELEIVTWKIVGLRPLMQSNYEHMMPHDTGTEGKVKARTKHRDPPFDEAKKQLYMRPDESDKPRYAHPALAFYRAMLGNCAYRKIGGQAASSVLPQCVMPLADEWFILYDPDTLDSKRPKLLTGKQWQMDSRRVVNEKVGALIAHRPKWPQWGGFLRLEVDREFVKTLDPLTDILNIAGRFGVGTGRMMKDPKSTKWGGLGLGKFTAELR